MKRFLYIFIILNAAISNIFAKTEAIKLVWPDDFKNASQYDGKLVELNQTLYVTNIYDWNTYGSITLSSKRLMSPTDVALPGSAEYRSIVTANEFDQLILSDGSDKQYPNPRPWTGDKNYIRTGAYTNKVVGTFTIEEYGYTITPTEVPVFEGNERPTKVRICKRLVARHLDDDLYRIVFRRAYALQLEPNVRIARVGDVVFDNAVLYPDISNAAASTDRYRIGDDLKRFLGLCLVGKRSCRVAVAVDHMLVYRFTAQKILLCSNSSFVGKKPLVAGPEGK